LYPSGDELGKGCFRRFGEGVILHNVCLVSFVCGVLAGRCR
jgi:hypothetical protein